LEKNMSDTFENSNTVFCPACQKENSKGNTFCAECGERIIPLGEDGAFAPPVAAEPAAETAVEAPVVPPWHEPSENPYANVNAAASAGEANPYSNPNASSPSAGSPYGGMADPSDTAPPSYQRAGGPSQPVSANTIGAKAPGESNALAIVSLVCGIASLVCCCLTFFTAIAGLITGIIVLRKNKSGRGFAIAGVVLSAAAAIIYAIIFIAYIVLIQETGRDFMDIYQGLGL
jgi:hypothetical protein